MSNFTIKYGRSSILISSWFIIMIFSLAIGIVALALVSAQPWRPMNSIVYTRYDTVVIGNSNYQIDEEGAVTLGFGGEDINYPIGIMSLIQDELLELNYFSLYTSNDIHQ